MMRTYVINLDRSPGRLAHMDAQLRLLGVPYERLPAIEGSADQTAGDALPLAPDIAVTLSHRKAWQAIASGNAPCGLVLEDDVHLAPTFPQFALTDDWIPRDADIVKLETVLRPVRIEEHPFCTHVGHALHRLRSGHAGAAGYVITARAARWLGTQPPNPVLPIDDWIFGSVWQQTPRLVIYQLDPAVCIQDMFREGASPNSPLASEALQWQAPRTLSGKVVKEAYRLRWRLADRIAALRQRRPPVMRKTIRFAD